MPSAAITAASACMFFCLLLIESFLSISFMV
jgi:hypothetical protein